MLYDLFISYCHEDADRVLPVVEALRAAGLTIWIDEREIEDFAAITRSIVEGLANSKALLAWYSAIYPESRACQWELTAAFLAAQRAGEVPRRVLLVNPEGDNGHIHPVELRDELYQQAPSIDDSGAHVSLAQTLKTHVDRLTGVLGGIQPLTKPPWYGKKGVGSNRFVGRLPDMWRLHTGLHAGEIAIINGSTAPGVAQISGMGGLGKSLLAEEYALRFGAAFPGGVFWLRGFGNDDAKAGMTPEGREAERTRQFYQMAAWLGIPLQGLTTEEVEGRLAAKLGGEGKPFLWVVDDIPSGMGVDNLQRWFAPHPVGKTLVITRSREYKALGTPVPLGVLQPDEAWQLLGFHRRPQGAAEEEAARGLLELLGYHALAVEVAGAALKAEEGLRTIAAYREALRHPTEDELELASALVDTLPSGHEASIAGTFLRSIGMLDPEGEDFLRLASVLAVAPVPAGLVQKVFAAVDGLDEDGALRRTQTALARVDRLSLADPAEAGQGMRTVHTLVSRTMWFRDRAPERRELVQRAAVQALLADLPKAVGIRSHGELAWAIPHARELSGRGDDLDAAGLMGWVARYELERGSYQVAETGYRNEWELRKRILGDEHPETLTAMNNLAVTLFARGDLPGARYLQEQVLDASRRILGDEHPDTLRAMLNLAGTLSAQGDLPGACDLQEQGLGASRRILGDEHPDTLTAMNDLAVTFFAQGDLPATRYLQEQVLDANRRVLGDEHPETLRAILNLAGTLSAQGDIPGACNLQEQVLDASRRILSDEHPITLTALNNLAQTLFALGNIPGARYLQEQVLDARRRVLGDEHPYTLTAMNNLAQTLFALGNIPGARYLQQHVLDASRRILGDEHPYTLTAMNNLAETLSVQGDLPGARGLQEQILDASRRILGDEHPDTLTAMLNLAGTLKAQGDLPGARDLQEQVLDASRRILGDEHPDTLRAMNNLAGTLKAQGDLPGARDLQEQVLDASRRILGEEHPNTTVSAWNLYRTLLDLQEEDAAGQVFSKHLAWLIQVEPNRLAASQSQIRQKIMDMREQTSDRQSTKGTNHNPKTENPRNIQRHQRQD